MMSRIYSYTLICCCLVCPAVLAFRFEGTILFKNGEKPLSLPENSYLIVKIEDARRFDSVAAELERYEKKVVGYPDRKITYKFDSDIGSGLSASSISVSSCIFFYFIHSQWRKHLCAVKFFDEICHCRQSYKDALLLLLLTLF